MAILGGRRFALHGIEPGDMVLVTYSLGLGNGGMAPREALWRYTRRGAGDDRQRRQHADAPPDRDRQGLGHQRDPRLPVVPAAHGAGRARRDGHRPARRSASACIGTHLGMESREQHRGAVERARAFDMYGTHESGMMAAECSAPDRHARAGRRVHPRDRRSGDAAQPCADGEKGTVYITTLYKYGAPQIRFNVNDISRLSHRPLPVRRHDAAAATASSAATTTWSSCAASTCFPRRSARPWPRTRAPTASSSASSTASARPASTRWTCGSRWPIRRPTATLLRATSSGA